MADEKASQSAMQQHSWKENREKRNVIDMFNGKKSTSDNFYVCFL